MKQEEIEIRLKTQGYFLFRRSMKGSESASQGQKERLRHSEHKLSDSSGLSEQSNVLRLPALLSVPGRRRDISDSDSRACRGRGKIQIVRTA